MSNYLSFNATVIADTGCSANGITSRHKSLNVVGFGQRGEVEISPLEDLVHLENPSSFQHTDWEDFAEGAPENTVALVAYGNYLYLNPVHVNEETGCLELVTGTMAGGNYAHGDSRFSEAVTAYLHELAPGASEVRMSYPLMVHDRIEF